MSDDRRFPIQARYGSDDPRSIAWTDAEIAYQAYRFMHPNGQTLDDLAARGGFGYVEFHAFNDAEVWMRANPRRSMSPADYIAQVRSVFDTALTARAAMHPARGRDKLG